MQRCAVRLIQSEVVSNVSSQPNQSSDLSQSTFSNETSEAHPTSLSEVPLDWEGDDESFIAQEEEPAVEDELEDYVSDYCPLDDSAEDDEDYYSQINHATSTNDSPSRNMF